MSNWNLLIIGGSAHLVDLDSEIIEIAGFGRFSGEAVRGQKIGTRFDLLGEKCLIARYALSDVQSNLKRGPQIVLPKDIAWMVYKSGLTAGDTVVEAGCGSAALTLALAQTVAPDGKVITFENNPRHFKIAEKNLEMSPWKDLVEIRGSQFGDETEKIETAAIVLDLPNPDEMIPWSKKSLRPGGFLLSYLPTVNQVESLLLSLEEWKEIEIVEIIQRGWQSKSNALRPKSNMLGHTGFIISARWNG